MERTSSPSYVSIDHAFYSTEGVGGGADYKGQNLKGRGLGGSFAWSLNNRWQFFSDFNALWLEGDYIGKEPANRPTNTDLISGKNSLANISFGLGIDTIKNPEKWAIPIFRGAFIQHYKTDMTSTALETVHSLTRITGEGYQYGVYAGFQLSRKIYENW